KSKPKDSTIENSLEPKNNRNIKTPETCIPPSSSFTSVYIKINDIIYFVNHVLSHSEIHTSINNIWTPDITFNFPIHKNFDKNKKGQTSKFQFNWLLRWLWLAYSEKEDGAFCKLCVALSKSEDGINSQKLGALVINKFDSWKHAIETFTKHDKLNYHIKSVIDTDIFLKTRNNPSISNENQLDTARSKQVNENRINILPIIEVIILCRRQKLEIRRHRDFGKINVDTIQNSKIIL
ncbi:zinc finger MYM-type protein 1-like, partial [Aphis craccivora]